MKYQKRYPVAALAPFVRHYWYFEIGAHEVPFSQLSFPYGAFELICYLENPNTMQWLGAADSFTEPSIFYAGQLTRPYVMSFDKACKCVGVSLYPWAGDHLYDIPANRFTNALVPLNELENCSRFYEELNLCTDQEELFARLERYMLQKLNGKANDPLAQHIAGHIINNPTREAVNVALSATGLSRRRVEQRFMDATGLSMGMFTRKIRFQKAVHLLKQEHGNLNTIGLRAGYYDQAHFISDLKTFSGLSPKDFRQQRTELKDFLTTLVLTE